MALNPAPLAMRHPEGCCATGDKVLLGNIGAHKAGLPLVPRLDGRGSDENPRQRLEPHGGQRPQACDVTSQLAEFRIGYEEAESLGRTPPSFERLARELRVRVASAPSDPTARLDLWHSVLRGGFGECEVDAATPASELRGGKTVSRLIARTGGWGSRRSMRACVQFALGSRVSCPIWSRRPVRPTEMKWPSGHGHPMQDSKRVLASLAGRLETQYERLTEGATDPTSLSLEAMETVRVHRGGEADATEVIWDSVLAGCVGEDEKGQGEELALRGSRSVTAG